MINTGPIRVRLPNCALSFNFALSLIVAVALWGGPAKNANAVTVLFQGFAGAGQGIIGHNFVAAGSIPHMAGFYGGVGVAGPYTRLASPDAFDQTSGTELPPGTNGAPFAASTPASAALAAVGINGSLHIGIAGFTLDTSLASGDLTFSSPTDENRIYRNGSAAIFEQTAPGVFAQVASYSDAIFDVDIDYSTGSIINTFSGTLDPGSFNIFPSSWTGTSFDPVDVAGTSALGIFGAFSVTSTLEITAAVPAPGTLAIFLLGLAGLRHSRHAVAARRAPHGARDIDRAS